MVSMQETTANRNHDLGYNGQLLQLISYTRTPGKHGRRLNGSACLFETRHVTCRIGSLAVAALHVQL
jgi:hypothetical protein